MGRQQYPVLGYNEIDLRHNIKTLIKWCSQYKVTPMFVSKGVCANYEVIKVLYDSGVRWIGDSRIQNLKDINSYNFNFEKKVLLRIPMKSELEDVIDYVDISFQSELMILNELSYIAQKKKKIHDVCLMIEQGDLREGILYEDVCDYIDKIINLKNINLIGIASNLTCLNGVIPTVDTVKKIEKIFKKINNRYNNKLNFISYGNSSSLDCMGFINQEGNYIRNIRLGESYLMGINTLNREIYKDLNQDIFKLYAQIIEIKEKPSKPWGVLSLDGFGNSSTYNDIGIRERAILGLGKQDVDIEYLEPQDKLISIIGQNSDHTLVDVTGKNCQVGDVIEFNMNYQGLLMLMTSKYVSKRSMEDMKYEYKSTSES